jgi:hypothetical protein
MDALARLGIAFGCLVAVAIGLALAVVLAPLAAAVALAGAFGRECLRVMQIASRLSSPRADPAAALARSRIRPTD